MPAHNYKDKEMSYYFGCINNSFKDLTNIKKLNFRSNTKNSQVIYFSSRFFGRNSKLHRKTLLKCDQTNGPPGLYLSYYCYSNESLLL